MKKLLFLILIVLGSGIYLQDNISLDKISNKYLPEYSEMERLLNTDLLDLDISKPEAKKEFNTLLEISPINEANQIINQPKSQINQVEAKKDIENSMLSSLKENVDLISMSDKMTIIGIILDNFTINELVQWQNKVLDGFSTAEKEELKDIVYERLSNEELSTLKDLYVKYLEQIDIEELEKISLGE